MTSTFGICATALAISTTLSLAACGGEAGGSDSKELVIGVSAPFSGPLASAGVGLECGASAYLEAVNDEGGLGGYTFEVVSKDNQYDPAIAATVARDFATDEVFAVFSTGTAPVEATSRALEGFGIPIFGNGDGAAVTPKRWDGEFAYNPVYEDEGRSGASFLIDQGIEKAATVFMVPAVEPLGDGFAAAFEELGGTVTAKEGVAPDVQDFTGVAQKLAASGSDAVYAGVPDTLLAGIQKAADAIGFHPVWVSWGTASGPTYLELAGELAEGTYFSQWAYPETETDNPDVATYLERVEATEGCGDLTGDVTLKIGYAFGAMVEHAVREAVDKDEEPTAESLIAILAEVSDEQFGTTPHMTFDEDSRAGVRENSYWQYKSGRLTLARDFQPLVAD